MFYEFYVFRFQNKTITHAAATAVHFLADAVCCFVTCIFITEVTKLSAGRLRPDFLQVSARTPSDYVHMHPLTLLTVDNVLMSFGVQVACYSLSCVPLTYYNRFATDDSDASLQFCSPSGGLQGQPARLAFEGSTGAINCTATNEDGRKSFPSGHASSSAVTIVYKRASLHPSLAYSHACLIQTFCFWLKLNAMDPYTLTLCSIVYNLWSGYFRGDHASFMGLNRQTGWRGGHRVYREIGHGAYLIFNLAQVKGCWGLGSHRQHKACLNHHSSIPAHRTSRSLVNRMS